MCEAFDQELDRLLSRVSSYEPLLVWRADLFERLLLLGSGLIGGGLGFPAFWAGQRVAGFGGRRVPAVAVQIEQDRVRHMREVIPMHERGALRAGDNTLVLRQLVTNPAGDDDGLTRVARRRGRIRVGLARVVIRGRDTGPENAIDTAAVPTAPVPRTMSFFTCAGPPCRGYLCSVWQA
jgi:hypothetical protein